MMKILVVGGTGKVGSEVVKELRKRNATVRALVRKEDDSPSRVEGVELVEGDLLDPVSVEKALDGVDKLYLLNAVVPDELTQGLIAYDLAKKLFLTSPRSLPSRTLCESSTCRLRSFVLTTFFRTTRR